MSRPRFKVATCYGYTLTPGSERRGGSETPGVTASVLDTANIHREVARYRSETLAGGRGRRLGREGALRAAQEHADRLNTEYGGG